jgi:hypothetical protein
VLCHQPKGSIENVLIGLRFARPTRGTTHNVRSLWLYWIHRFSAAGLPSLLAPFSKSIVAALPKSDKPPHCQKTYHNTAAQNEKYVTEK